jgi:hypothetical protein
MTIPSVGEATFKVTDMANKAVDKVYQEQLMENIRDLKALYEDCGLTEEEMNEVKRQANAYRNNDWEAGFHRTVRRTADTANTNTQSQESNA